MNVQEFYDDFASKYTDSVHRCNPCYAEMIQSLLMFLPETFAPQRMLELGCGSGSLTLVLREAYPQAKLTALDISEDLLAVCRERVGADVELVRGDMRELPVAEAPYDLVCSSLAIHHLSGQEKQELFRILATSIAPSGFLIFCDRFKSEADYLSEINHAFWHSSAMAAGASEEEWATWNQHNREHDRPDTLANQMTWLRDTGFSVVECVWRHSSWATIHCRR